MGDTPEVPGPTPQEEVLIGSLSPDEIALEGLERICLVDPKRPELGFKMREEVVE